MNSNQIKCFLSVAKTLSFTQSARNLFLSQSTISKNIKNLEKELDCQLLDRSHQQVKLTVQGQFFFKKMSNISKEIENTISQLHHQNSIHKPTVYLGYMDIPFEEAYMPIAIRLINQKYNVNLRLRVIDPNSFINLRDTLKNGDLDFLIYQKDFFNDDSDFLFTPLLARSFSVLVNQDDPLYLKSNINIADLQDRKIWIWNTKYQLPTVQKLISRIKASNIDCILKHISDVMVLSDYVLSNNGIGIVPGVLYDKNAPSLRYIPLDSNVDIIYGIAELKENCQNNYSKEIIHAIKQAVEIAQNEW